MTDGTSPENELERLQSLGVAVLRDGGPKVPPLQFLLFHLADWIDQRHIAAIQKKFPEGRRTFNPVFIHLPADGCRLTELARMANMSKQAMAEVVEEMIALGFLARFEDPSDRRAKIIIRAPKGIEAHKAAMDAFEEIDLELSERLGKERLSQLRIELGLALDAISEVENQEAKQ